MSKREKEVAERVAATLPYNYLFLLILFGYFLGLPPALPPFFSGNTDGNTDGWCHRNCGAVSLRNYLSFFVSPSLRPLC